MEKREKKKDAATYRRQIAATREGPARCRYLLSFWGAGSSIAHGQKFCGLRVAEAFWTTLIFMSLLRFC